MPSRKQRIAAFAQQFTYTNIKSEVINSFKQFGLQQLREDAAARSWLFRLVCGWCALFAVVCFVLAAAVAAKSLISPNVSARPAIPLAAIGILILASTGLMWKLSKMGRNVAVVTVACMSWVVGTSLGLRTGANVLPMVMTITFTIISVACFTSPSVIALFTPKDPEDNAAS